MEGGHRLHRELVRKADAQSRVCRPKFRIVAGMAGLAITTALILSPLNLGMAGQDAPKGKKGEKAEASEVAKPVNITASKLSLRLDEKKITPHLIKDTILVADAKGAEELKLAGLGTDKIQPKDKGKGEIKLAQVRKVKVDSEGQEVDFNSFPKIPLDSIKNLEGETAEVIKTYGGFTLIETKEKDGHDYFSQAIHVPTSDENGAIVAFVAIGLFEGKEFVNESSIVYNKNGRQYGGVEQLDLLADSYAKATGLEMKQVKIIIEQGHDKQIGRYISMIVVPVDDNDWIIKSGTPCMVMSYYNGAVHKGGLYLIE